MAADDQVMLDAWNGHAGTHGLRAVRHLDAERRKKLATLRREYDQTTLLDAIAVAGASAFCRGQGDRGWRAGFDWFLRPATVRALGEEGYDDRHAPLVSEKMQRLGHGFADAAAALKARLTREGK